MNIELLSTDNLHHLTQLALELWQDCDFKEEYESYKNTIASEDEACYLVKEQEQYIAFTHVTIRRDYVEGAAESPVAYVEALYVQPSHQKLGIGKRLIRTAEEWGRQRGCKQLASDAELDNSASIDFHMQVGFNEANRVVCFIKEL